MTPRRNLLLLPLFLALVAGVLSLATTEAQASPRAKTYTVTRTFGPFNGEDTQQNGLPGQLPDGEALWVACDANDRTTGHSLSVDRLGGRKVLRLDRKGVEFSTYEPDENWMFYAYFTATGQPGWNKVRMSITCRDTAAPYRR